MKLALTLLLYGLFTIHTLEIKNFEYSMLLVHKFYHFSEDKENDTLEFNEYLTMLGLQNIEQIQYDSLLEALRLKIEFF